LIFVPAAQSVVRIAGAIRRAANYEITQGEGVVDLVGYAGGLDRGAFLSGFDLERFENDRKVYKQIPYAQLVKSSRDYPLQHGDEITIDRIDETLESYVSVLGEVKNAGRFEFTEGLTLKEVVLLADPLSTARLNAAYLRRTNLDGTVSTIPISIVDIVNGEGTSLNVELQERDEITIWPLERFEDLKEVKIAGAAHIHRLDPRNPQELEYVRIDLERVINDANAIDNIALAPFDSIHVYSREEFLEDVNFSVEGAVNNPGEFLYGDGMTLRDAIVLAGGFRLSAATNNIEISRVIIEDNEPTRTTIKKVSLTRAQAKDFSAGVSDVQLEPLDIVRVRYVPQFELQQNIIIAGEVTLPGAYSLERDNERVFDMIARAGGLTPEAFPASATMNRSENELGQMVMRLDEVIGDPSSKFNYTLRNGDSIYIPKIQDYVLIQGEAQHLIQSGEKQKLTPYHKGENALFYIEEYAGGFTDDAIKDKIFVTYPNGEVRKTEKRFLAGKKHPEVVPGAIIQIGKKKPEIDKGDKEEDVNWTKVLGDSVAQAASILTLLLLIQRLD